jgi:two-component sensor histidine kinase
VGLEAVGQDSRRIVLDVVEIEIGLRSPGRARAFVRRTLEAHGVSDEWADGVVLMASELVSNVVMHAKGDGSPMWVVVMIQAGEMLRLEVHDRDDTMPVPRVAADSDVSGRGLQVVSSLASRWGAAPTATGKYVYCEMPYRTLDEEG